MEFLIDKARLMDRLRGSPSMQRAKWLVLPRSRRGIRHGRIAAHKDRPEVAGPLPGTGVEPGYGDIPVTR